MFISIETLDALRRANNIESLSWAINDLLGEIADKVAEESIGVTPAGEVIIDMCNDAALEFQKLATKINNHEI